MRLRQLMQPTVLETFREECLADAAGRMRDHGVGALLVMEDEELVGIITERDLLRAMAEGLAPRVTPVSAFMSPTPVTAGPDDDVATAARLMVEHEIRHLPITEGDRVLGVVSARDVLVAEQWPQEPAPPR